MNKKMLDYEKPALLDLTANRALGAPCSAGTSPTYCKTGANASEVCWTGDAPVLTCRSGAGASDLCLVGSGGA
jgi:hypothetical protein